MFSSLTPFRIFFFIFAFLQFENPMPTSLPPKLPTFIFFSILYSSLFVIGCLTLISQNPNHYHLKYFSFLILLIVTLYICYAFYSCPIVLVYFALFFFFVLFAFQVLMIMLIYFLAQRFFP